MKKTMEIDQLTYKQAKLGKIYPCTIVEDRYSGSYSNAQWLAFHADAGNIPPEIGSSDGDEMAFWEGELHKDFLIGLGDTPNDALGDLLKKILSGFQKQENQKIIT
jgi:hypothetical protein